MANNTIIIYGYGITIINVTIMYIFCSNIDEDDDRQNCSILNPGSILLVIISNNDNNIIIAVIILVSAQLRNP